MGSENYAIGGLRISYNNNGHDAATGDGYFNLGNLVSGSLTNEITRLPHLAFLNATKSRSKDFEIVTDTAYGLTAIADELSNELWDILSSGDGLTTSVQTASTETSESATSPLLGDRNMYTAKTDISAYALTGLSGSPTYTNLTDYEVTDAEEGEVLIKSTGAITASLALEHNYVAAARTTKTTNVGLDSILQGSARVKYTTQNGIPMRWVIHNCIISIEGDLPLTADAFTEAPITLTVVADKVVDPDNPFGVRHLVQ